VAALPPAVLAHDRPRSLAAVLGGALPPSPQRDECNLAVRISQQGQRRAERYDVLVSVDRPGMWAFHCHILNHVEGMTGMFGMVSTLIVVPEKAHVDAIVNALIA
jgi:FtsP/CotA-like multicopper oxidase with cupredoxin domain